MPHGSAGPHEPRAFDAHIQRIRTVGYEKMPSATAIGVTNIAFPIFGPSGHAAAVLSCPYLERVDDLGVPSLDEIVEMYGALARELTEFYSGKLAEFVRSS